MTNLFLKVNKDIFKLGLNPTEILIIAQVMEFNTNTGDCFISDKALAESFGVSEKTISRTLKALEEKGYITRDTKSVKGGRERHIKVNQDKLEEQLTKDKLTLDGDIQRTICLLSMDNLSIDKGQNDFIKDNIQDNSKDNFNEMFHPSDENITLSNPEEEDEVKSTAAAVCPEVKENYPTFAKIEVDRMGCEYESLGNNLVKILATGKIIKLV